MYLDKVYKNKIIFSIKKKNCFEGKLKNKKGIKKF